MADTSGHRAGFHAAAAALRAGEASGLVGQIWADGAVAENGADLLNLAGLCRDAFGLQLPHAPGLRAFGAIFAPEDVGIPTAPAGSNGAGLSLGAAFERCMGEVCEHWGFLEHPDDPLIHPDPPASPVAEPWATEVIGAPQGDWVTAVPFAGGAPGALPAELVLRRPGAPYQASSVGLGAGPTVDVARWSGLLECIERDAVALWWRGGAPGRPVTPKRALDLATRIRDDARPVWFLDITTDLEIPVVVALSSAPDGTGVVAGASAALDTDAAAQRALIELCQMELSRALSLARLDRGESVQPQSIDWVWKMREDSLSTSDSPRLLGDFGSDTASAAPLKKDQALQKIHARGLLPYVVTLTRGGLKVPTVRVILAGAQLDFTGPDTQRLQHCADANGQSLDLTADFVAPL